MTWIAHIFQRPGEKPGTAVVIRGDKGAGKSTVAEWLGAALGRYALDLADDKLLTGQFNAHQQGKLFVISEESTWAGDKKLKVY